MKKILLISSLLFIISSNYLFADRETANINASGISALLENEGYSIRDIAGKHLSNKGYRTYNRFLYSDSCYAIVSVGDDGVIDLDLKVWNSTDHSNWVYLGSEDSTDKSAIIKPFCPTRSGRYSFRTIMYNGSGDFRMLIGWK